MPKTLLQINTVINSGSTGRIAEEIGVAKRGQIRTNGFVGET